ncbi:hypothetical protein CK203_080733 [Vitis vinifera]|uniref:Uncharacterized protein n=1 Tax=Vitis vinifera TaxID=29760 RepID=A0A438DZB0_VITVI|nr:hypothetical protein CK203_080733 [Vitis vinifera]
MMGNKSCCWFVFFFFIIFSSFVAQSHGRIRKQTELLNILRKAKMQGNSGIDTSLFEVNEIESEAESYKILPQKGMKEKDRIERLPGQPHVGFSQYGGYVTIDESKVKLFTITLLKHQLLRSICLFFSGLMVVFIYIQFSVSFFFSLTSVLI